MLLNMQKAIHGMFTRKLRKAKCKANQFSKADLFSLTVLLISIHSICMDLKFCYFSYARMVGNPLIVDINPLTTGELVLF